MYVKTVEETYVNRRWNTEAIRHCDVFICDECVQEYTLGHKAANATNDALTFCSSACNKRSRSVGKLAEQWRRTKLERYGVEHSSQVSGAVEKMIVTRVERTGAKGPTSKSSTSNVQWRETMVERHGVEHPSKSAIVREKKRLTYRKRYGVDNPFSTGSRFRLDHDALSEAGQRGYRSTTRDPNGWMTSNPEKLLLKFLLAKFKHVEPQALMPHGVRKSWLVDAYVHDIQTYVQADGVFWHGLDRPYDELHPKGREAYDRDREQDEWFRASGHRLVRVTDQEIMMCHELNDWSLILTRLEG
jgi:hypothetical protein